MTRKVKIDREVIKDHPASTKAKELLVDTGNSLTPVGYEHQASVSIHFYRSGFKTFNNDLYAFIVHHTGFKEIPEPQADAGFKEMMRTMMSAYGRKPPAATA